MKLKVLTALVFCFLFFLAACGPANKGNQPNPTPSPTAKDKWNFKIVGGTTNIDESFFNISGSSLSTASLTKRNNALVNTFFDHTGMSLSPQATAATGINIYASLYNEAKPNLKPDNFVLLGPKGLYKGSLDYPEGAKWAVFFPIASQGSGTYQAKVNIDDQQLSTSTFINSSKHLSIPQMMTAGKTDDLFKASWKALPRAQSYLVSLYDFDLEKVIGVYLTDQTELSATNVPFTKNHKTDMTVFALTWNAQKDRENEYPEPLPGTFDVSIVSLYLDEGIPQINLNYEDLTNGLVLTSSKGKSVTQKLSLQNTGSGILHYKTAIHNQDKVEITQNSEGLLTSGEQIILEISLNCGDDTWQSSSSLILNTNIVDQPQISLPLMLECLNDLKPQIILNQTLEIKPQLVRFANLNSEIYLVSRPDYQTHLVSRMTLDGNLLISKNLSTYDVFSAHAIEKTGDLSIISSSLCNPPGNSFCSTVFDKASGELKSNQAFTLMDGIRYSPDGSAFAGLSYAENQMTIAIFDSMSSELVQNLTPPSNIGIGLPYWSHSGKEIASRNFTKLLIWNIETGVNSVIDLPDHNEAPYFGCSSGSSYWGEDDKSFHLGNCLVNLVTKVVNYKGRSQFPYDGIISNTSLYKSSYDGENVYIYSSLTGRHVASFGHGITGVTSFTWSAGDKYFALIGDQDPSGQISIWQLEELE
ncbi:MAG: hypothetical protein KC422_18960 [Trueperaceae bacterium]|nr:hypothetical protein [Trueperaceae bacterium]